MPNTRFRGANSITFAARPGDAYPRTSPLPARTRQRIRARHEVTRIAEDQNVGSLHNRLARALSGDSSVHLTWLHGSWARCESDIDAANPSAIKDSIRRLAGTLDRAVPSGQLDLVTWAPQEPDELYLRRVPLSGRRSRLEAGISRIPRRHRHHQRMVVVDALAMQVRGRGLAVDDESKRFVLDDDGVGRRCLAWHRRVDCQSVRIGEPERAIVEALHVEPALVHQSMVGRARQDGIVKRGLPADGLVPHVMTVEAMGGGAAGESAEDRKNNPSIWVAGKVSRWSVRACCRVRCPCRDARAGL